MLGGGGGGERGLERQRQFAHSQGLGESLQTGQTWEGTSGGEGEVAGHGRPTGEEQRHSGLTVALLELGRKASRRALRGRGCLSRAGRTTRALRPADAAPARKSSGCECGLSPPGCVA